VNKKVSEFPPTRDLSTPEAAYATMMRDFVAAGASGAEWDEISVRRSQSPSTKRRPVAPEVVRSCLEAHLEEVAIYRDRLASVIARTQENGKISYDQRTFFLRGGRWLNVRQVGAPTVDEARYAFVQECESCYRSCMKEGGETVEPRWNRPPIADPESHLKPYVEFLREHGREPHAFLMEAFARYELVVMGEIHHRPAYWAFHRDLVRDPAFAEAAGTIYLELPSNHQQNIEAFLAGATCQKELVIQMLRDFFELGWPCQPTLEFLVAVWEVNQKLRPDQKLRLRLVDMQRPWEKIHKSGDWASYEVDRDLLMAQNILKDRQANPDQRHGFFIVGMNHAMEGLCFGDQTTARRSAGWHLKRALGDRLFTVLQHAPVQTNRGEVSGRLALGLIDSALAQRRGPAGRFYVARRAVRRVAFRREPGCAGLWPFPRWV
jgi:hypothetical protein